MPFAPNTRSRSWMVTIQVANRVEQLLRRLDEIWYKYKENGVYKTYKIPAEEYIDYDDLKSRASKDGFVPVDEYENIPFDS